MKRKLFGAAALLAGAIFAATSSTWETSTPADLLKGRLQGLSMTGDGTLRLGPSVKATVAVNQPALWSMAPAPGGGVYASTGHRGEVYRVDASGKAERVWSAEQPEVFALCVDAQHHLYAGTSPNGGIYRIENGKGVAVARLGAKYIWALVAAPDGTLFAGTGDQGQIYRIDRSGKVELYFETGQANITSLALGPNGSLYAGSEPNGLLYQITGLKTGSVIYDSSLPEIHAIEVKADGTVFAAAMGGSLASRTATPASSSSGTSSPVVSGGTTVISVTEAKDNSPESTPEQGGDIKVKEGKPSVTSTITPAAAPSTSTVVDMTNVEKSAIYRISPGGAIETLRTSKEDNVYDLLLSGDNLLFSTDVRGRIYSMTPDRKQTMLIETGDGDATRLLRTSEGTWVGIGNPGKVVLIGDSPSRTGSYESVVHDASSISRWGRLSWDGNASGVSFRTRTGNSGRPDSTWSPWSEPIANKEDALIKSPRARFIQWRAEWNDAAKGEVEGVTVPFLPQNAPPVVRSISVNSVAATGSAKSSSQSSSSSAYSVTVTDTGDAPASSGNTQTQTLPRQNAAQTQVSWQADDPDGDKLIYSLYFKGEAESSWKLLKKDIYDNTTLLDQDSLADGKYLFRVVASDRPSNDVRYAQQSELVSMTFIIDNTPPTVTLSPPVRKDGGVDLAISAQDQTTALRRCEYSVDAGPWQPLEAEDGITDSPRENFRVHLDTLANGEHLVVFRVYDSAGNVGLAKAVVR